MHKKTLIISYIFIAFYIGGGLLSAIEDHDKNPKAYNELLLRLLDVGRIKNSSGKSEIAVTDHLVLNLTFVSINNYYNSSFNSSNVSEVEKNYGKSSPLVPDRSFPGLNDQCLLNKDCRNISYSKCSLGKCSCKHNYLPLEGRCKGLIEEACEEDSDCGVGNSTCQSGYCACKTGYYSSDNNKCYQTAKEPGDFCESNQGCREVKRSTCFNNSCDCKSNYRQRGKLCLGFINAECSSDQDCAINNSICQLNTCQCPDNFYLDDDTCYEYADNLTGDCQTDEACKHLQYTTCTDGQCLCLPNYDGSSETCLGMENASCNNPTECVANNAVCNGSCQCPDNHYFENKHCYKFADRLFAPVASALACQHLENTSFFNGRCECSQGYYYENHHCYEIPIDYNIPVDTVRACEYLLDAFYVNGRCYTCAEDSNANVPPSTPAGVKVDRHFFWVDASEGKVPPRAIEGGQDNGPLFICLASHEGVMIPGKLNTNYGFCYVPWKGREHAKSDYQVLCGCKSQWVAISDGIVLPNAIIAVKIVEGESLVICRVLHNGTVTIGKFKASHNVCYIPYGGAELMFQHNFEILVGQ